MKYILFDFFGVLSTPSYYTVIEKHISKDKQQHYKNLLDDLDMGNLSEDALVKMISDESNLSKNVIWNEVNSIPALNAPLFDFIENNLKEKYKIGLLTNAPRTLIDRLISNKLYLFDLELVSSDLKMIKPNEDIFIETIKRCDCEPSDIFFIDDSEKNINMASIKNIKGHVFKDLADLVTKLGDENII